jgi:uncharacterized protein YuzE
VTDAPKPYTYAYQAGFNYEKEVRALDLRLAQGVPLGKVARTVEMPYVTVLCDLDENGRVLGLEILDPFPPGAEIATAAPERTDRCPS